jgi:hypothetical protein
MFGSSFSYGYMTRYEDAYTTLAGAMLSQKCGRQVEFQNTGFPNSSLLDVYRRIDEVLALQPDMILLALNAADVRKDISPELLSRRNEPPAAATRTEPPETGGWLQRDVLAPLQESRVAYMAQHFLYQNPDTYLNLYLLYGDKAGYVRATLTPAWQQRMNNLDLLLGDMAQAASLPMAIFVGPLPSQVAILNTPPRADADAYAFATNVGAIAAKHGIPVINPLPRMAGRPAPMSLFYVVDGHLAKPGQRILAEALSADLLSGRHPAFASCK